MKNKFQEYLEGLKGKRDMSGPSYDTRNKEGRDDGPSTEEAIKAVCQDLHYSIADHFPSDDEEFIFNSIVKHYRKNYLR